MPSRSISLNDYIFLSTPSARRATVPAQVRQPAQSISIHALREEGDGQSRSFLPGCRYFYPRPPRGGRPVVAPVTLSALPISIHALREEGDRQPTGN